jgi:hypothetical protein
VLSLEFDDDPEPGWEERCRSITEAQADQVIEYVESGISRLRSLRGCGPTWTAGQAAFSRTASPNSPIASRSWRSDR